MKRLDPERRKALSLAHGIEEEVIESLCVSLQRWGWSPPPETTAVYVPSTLVLTSSQSNEQHTRSPEVLLPSEEEALNPLSTDPSLKLGRYQLLGTLGSGGMGEVFRVFDPDLGREIAMKCIHPTVASISEVVEQFLNEAQLTSRLQHPSIIPVHEVGRLPNGELFFTMPIIQGRSLKDLIRARFKKGESEAKSTQTLHRLISLFHNLCNVVAYSHSVYQHCDLASGLWCLGEPGRTRLGVARAFEHTQLNAKGEILLQSCHPSRIPGWARLRLCLQSKDTATLCSQAVMLILWYDLVSHSVVTPHMLPHIKISDHFTQKLVFPLKVLFPCSAPSYFVRLF